MDVGGVWLIAAHTFKKIGRAASLIVRTTLWCRTFTSTRLPPNSQLARRKRPSAV
jgi:hypothetical protein